MDHLERSLRNGFALSGLDRATLQRGDDGWLEAQLGSPTARCVPVWRGRHFCGGPDDAQPEFPRIRDVGGLLPGAESVSFLGLWNGEAYFALGLPEGEEAVSPLGTADRFRGLRSVAPLVGQETGNLLAHASAVVYWHRRHRFCGECGTPTRSLDAGHLRVCTARECGSQFFPRTDPAIIVLVSRGERCLLGRQARWPGAMYSTLAGFVEPGEPLEAAVVREVEEETGIRVGSVFYQSSQPWPFPCSIMLGFRAQGESEAIELRDEELEDARWFSREELAEGFASGALALPSSFSIAYRLIEGWFDEGAAVPLVRVRDELARRDR